MSPLRRPRFTARRLVAAVAVLAVLGTGATVYLRSGPAPVDLVPTQDLRLDTPAGPGQTGTVSLDATVYLPKRTPAPAVLVAHGFGGSKSSVDADARELAARGFVVLAWSARGFGQSTGQIALNSPDAEVADGSRLIDYLATRPEVLLDGPGDPRVGVTGASYGGALSLLLAGYDKRVDAIAPVITWNDLGQALFPNAGSATPPPVDTAARGAFGPDGVFKRGWASIFFSSGLTPAPAPTPAAATGPAGTASSAPAAGSNSGSGSGSNSGSGSGSGTNDTAASDTPAGGDTAGAPPAGSTPSAPIGLPGLALITPPPAPTSCGRFVPQICEAYSRVAASGRIDAATAELLRRNSPASIADRIKAPTLLVQGESDTLFGLDQADATARQIASTGGSVRVIWYSGGHDGGAPGPSVREQIGSWFDRYLARDPSVDPVDTAPGGLSYAVQSGIRSGGRNSSPTVRTVDADRYPGLSGDPVGTTPLPLHGGPQSVLNPPGGYPASITSVPGVSGSLGSLAGRLSALATDLPGQTATFSTDPLPRQLVVAGASRVRLTVSPVPGQPSAADAVLFVRLNEVAGDGRRTLLGGAVAPVRVPIPAGGGPAEVTVTLPGVVAPIESGHRLVVSVATTDQSYLGPVAPAIWKVALAGENAQLTVPVVPGRAVTRNTVPLAPALGIAAILLAAVVVARMYRRRRRAAEDRSVGADSDLPLVVDGLAKRYPGGITAVNGVSFHVRPDQVVGLLGPNGAGKTTVLRMLMGLLLPSGGELRVYGHPVAPGAPVLSRVGSFVEGPGFLPHLSGLRNLELYWGATGRPTAEARFDEALEIAGLGSAVNRAVRTYSQGMRQRLAIAQAMLGLPDLLVLDEPTNGLDPPQIHAMREVLRSYAREGRSVLISSHLLAEVEQSCDHVVVMHRGRVVADGSVADIVAGGGQATFRVDDPARAARVLGENDAVRGVEVDGDNVYAELNGTPRSEAVGWLVRAGVSVEAAGPRRRLEDAFLQLVGEDTTP